MKVLCYKDKQDKCWIAAELTSDIFTQGKTRKEALNNLADCVDIQFRFAIKKNNLRVLDRKTPLNVLKNIIKENNIK